MAYRRLRDARIRSANPALQVDHPCRQYDIESIKMQGLTLIAQQIKAVRGALGWSVQELSESAEVGSATISRYELASCILCSRRDSLEKIRATFEALGIELIGSPDDRPCILIGEAPDHDVKELIRWGRGAISLWTLTLLCAQHPCKPPWRLKCCAAKMTG